jgi:NAD(P)H-dependent FMN reductase
MTDGILVFYGSYRSDRMGIRLANFIVKNLRERGCDTELIDAKAVNLPMLDRMRKEYPKGQAPAAMEDLAQKIIAADGFVFVTGEYNHGAPAVLKNALDYVYAPFNRKAVAFVGYGGVGAARAVEHLRLVAIELQAAPVRNAVHIGLAEFLGVLQQGKAFGDFPHLGQSATATLDDLEWWANALKTAREANQAASS